MKKFVGDLIEKSAENTKKQLEQVNKKLVNLTKQNNALRQELRQVKQQIEVIKDLVTDLKNKMEQPKEGTEDQPNDQPNGEASPPPAKKSKVYSIESLLTEGFKKFVDFESDDFEMSYVEWYEKLWDITKQKPLNMLERTILMKWKRKRKKYEVIFNSWKGNTNRRLTPTCINTYGLDEGWDNYNVKHVIIFHPTEHSKCLVCSRACQY